MTIQYIAKDGTVFYDEDECKDYEAALISQNFEGIVKFFDEDYNYIGYDYHALEEAFFCIIVDHSRLPDYRAYLDFEGYELPQVNKPNTVYRWNYRLDKWEDMEKIAAEINEAIRLVKEEAGIYGS